MDTVHTNRQRFEKIEAVYNMIDILHKHRPSDPEIESLKVLAEEAKSSTNAIKSFLNERKALDNKE